MDGTPTMNAKLRKRYANMKTFDEQAKESYRIIDELNYICYRHNRKISPNRSPDYWSDIFPNYQDFEERFQLEGGSK